ncbi:MAG: hypothetical protein MUF66_08680 [Gammaproteobacteria bacterium]|jgi:hypothetical protein|nr:hypothetical protein [Gammaproteobacteria bacterium]
MYVVRHRDRNDPPGQWSRSGPFVDREAAEAFVARLAREHSDLEDTRIEAEDERLACS